MFFGVIMPFGWAAGWRFNRVYNGQRGQAKRLFQGQEWLSLRNIDLDWSAWNDLQKGGQGQPVTS
jgi:hypothetical protein